MKISLSEMTMKNEKRTSLPSFTLISPFASGRLPMEHPFQSILLFFLALVASAATSPPDLEPCPSTKVCALFMGSGISCTQNGGVPRSGPGGYVWEAGTKCDRPIYEQLYAALEIEPLCVRKWQFTVTTRVEIGKHSIENMTFDFGKAKITFSDFKTSDFTWKKGEDCEISLHILTLGYSLKEINRFESPVLFVKYAFKIGTEVEKLINLLGVDTIAWVNANGSRLEFHNRRIPDLLREINSQNIESTADAQCAGIEYGTDLERCPANKVCAIFVGSQGNEGINCTQGDGSWGAGSRGYVWAAKTKCDMKVYNKLYAALEIRPLFSKQWFFTVTTWAKSGEQSIETIQFDFGKAKIRFPNDSTAEFMWKRGDDWHFSNHSLEKISEFDWSPEYKSKDRGTFMKYSFEIFCLKEDLIDLLGVDQITWEQEYNPDSLRDPLRIGLSDVWFPFLLRKIGMSTLTKMAYIFGIGIPVLALIIIVICCLKYRNGKANNNPASVKTSDFSKKRTDIGKASKRGCQSTDSSELKSDKSQSKEGSNSSSAHSPLIEDESKKAQCEIK